MNINDIEKRPYAWINRRFDITGQRFGRLVAREHVGFKHGCSYWLFDCDCGGKKISSGPQMKYEAKVKDPDNRLHCGCQDHRSSANGQARHPAYHIWKRLRPKMDQDWGSNFSKFLEECWVHKDDKYLVRPDKTRPLGPDNFRWDSHFESYYATIDQCIHILQADFGDSLISATERVWKMSRQRRAQIVARHNHLCTTCFKPAMPGYVSCHDCNEKHKAYCGRKAREAIQTS